MEADNIFYIKLYGMQALKNLESEFSRRELILNDKIAKEEKNKTSGDELTSLRTNLDRAISQKKKLTAILSELKKVETDQKSHFNFGN